MTIQLSGNTSMPPSFPGVAQASATRTRNRRVTADAQAGLFGFVDASDSGNQTVDVITSGNVPASVSEIAGVFEYLAGKTASGASGEQYASGDIASLVDGGNIWVQAAESGAGNIKDGVPAYCRIDTTIDGKATDTSTNNILVGVFRSTLQSNGAALVELRLGV